MAEPDVPPPLNFARRLLLGAIALYFFLLFARSLPSLAVDLLWFREVGFDAYFIKRLGTQVTLAVVAGGIFAGIFVANVLLALRKGPASFTVVREMEVILPALERTRPRLRQAAWALAGLLGLIAAQWGAGRWQEWLWFRHQAPFGRSEPVFGLDLSFHVFTLPLLQSVVGFLFVVVLISALASGFAYFIQGRIWMRPGFLSITKEARAHLLSLAALALVLIAAGEWLARFDLLRSTRGIVHGAGHADLHAALPGLTISAGVALVGALLIAADVFRSGFRLTLLAAFGTLVLHLGLVELWPAGIQRFIVAPNELERERPYLEREIAATRYAYDLEDIEEGRFPATENLTAQAVAENAATVDNLRLWESGPLKITNQQLQEIRTYYDFVDVDHDRYRIDGDLRQVALSPRELNPSALPSRTWINEHLTYTHGYGVCVATVNEISPEGLPVYLVQDLPPASVTPDLAVRRPEIYYGELAAEYAFVNTKSREFDYPSGDENVYTSYEGRGGIALGGLAARLLFALHLVEPKVLLTGDLTAESRVLIYRTVRERIERVAPYLLWEDDPYMVIRADGSLAWMLDGYTVTDRIPYSTPLRGVGNYIRNPVKAVVDAYHGSVTLYAVDESDPVLATYRRMFPESFAPGDSMPADLRAHMRYPSGLFAVQAEMYATYHMTDPQVFYNKEDLWKVADRSDGTRMAPYYTITKLAGVGGSEEFILMLPFTPARKENMIAWIAARCDPPNYGGILLYSFPKQRLIFGPQQIESRINQDTDISKELTLWNQQGSEVIRGNLLVVPVDSSLVYFQPLYLRAAAQRGLPELKRIVVAHGNRIAMESTMERALARVFGEGATPSDAVALAASDGDGASGPAAADGSNRRLAEAADRYERAQQALRRGDLQAYAREIEELGRILGAASR